MDTRNRPRVGARSGARMRWVAAVLLLVVVPLELGANRSREELLAAREQVAQRMEIVPYKRIPDVIVKRRDEAGRLVPDRKADHVDLRLSIVRPRREPAGGLRPAVLFFHGGGFWSGSPTQFLLQADYFARRGAVAFCVEYRLKEKVEVTIAEQLADARDALRWVRANAAALAVDPAQVAAVGGSAGGYLALASAVLPGVSPAAVPDAVVAFNPAIDFDFFARQQGELAMRRSLGGGIEDYSCTPHLRPGLPPVLIFQGEADETTPHAIAAAFARRAAAVGTPVQLVSFPGLEHGFHNRDPYLERCAREAVDFLRRQGFALGR